MGVLQQIGTHFTSQCIRLLHPPTLDPLPHPRTPLAFGVLMSLANLNDCERDAESKFSLYLYNRPHPQQ